MKVEASIDIHAPIEKVFTVFTDLSHATERIDGIDHIEILENSPQMTVGTKWKETRKIFGKEATEVMWVTAINTPKNYVVEAESNNMKYESEYVFTSTDSGTHVSLTFTGHPQTIGAKIMNLLFSFMAGTTKKMLQQDMEDLKKVCEA